MRVWCFPCLWLCLLLALTGSSAAQETNFEVGPQYLAPAGSFRLQPIATPTSEHGSDLGPPQAPAQETNFGTGPQYLIPSAVPLLLHPISTPILSFPSGLTQTPTTEVEETPPSTETYSQVSAMLDDEARMALYSIYYGEERMALYSIYYGYPQRNVIEIAFRNAAEREATPPSSITDSGVVQLTSAEALRDRGYGITLAEAAARTKAHKVSARHAYTNEDVERLRSRN